MAGREVQWLVLFSLTLLLIGAASASTSAQAATVTVVPVPDGGETPDAEIDSQGRIHLAYVKGDDAYYVTSADSGRTFSRPLRINSEPGTVSPPDMYRGPDLAIGKDDQVHAIWFVNAYQRKRPKNEWGVYYSQLAPTGDAFLPARNLNMRPSDNYSIAADRNGNVAVFWTADATYVNFSRDGGRTFASAVVAHPKADSCDCCATRAVYSPDGRLYMIYRDKAGNMRDMYLLRRDPEMDTFARLPLSVTPWQINACPMAGASLGLSPGKGLVAGWQRESKIYVGRLDSTGRLIPPGEIVAPGDGRYPVVLSNPAGAMLAAWKNGTTLYWQLYDAAGRPEGQVGSMLGTTAFRPGGVVARDGRFLLFP